MLDCDFMTNFVSCRLSVTHCCILSCQGHLNPLPLFFISVNDAKEGYCSLVWTCTHTERHPHPVHWTAAYKTLSVISLPAVCADWKAFLSSGPTAAAGLCLTLTLASAQHITLLFWPWHMATRTHLQSSLTAASELRQCCMCWILGDACTQSYWSIFSLVNFIS